MSFENFCYKVFNSGPMGKGINFDGASESCSNNQAILASLHSEDERDFVTDVLMSDPLQPRQPVLVGAKGRWMKVLYSIFKSGLIFSSRLLEMETKTNVPLD